MAFSKTSIDISFIFKETMMQLRLDCGLVCG
jgi:hypothetical protein